MLEPTSVRAAALATTITVAVPFAQADPPPVADLVAGVDVLAREALDRPGGVGLSIAVARDGAIVVENGYGLAEAEHDVPANAETMFRIGSVTKQFTASAIMRLVEQGRLSLADDLTKFFPEYPVGDRVVTVRHLLNHTSGIPSYTSVQAFMERDVALELEVDELLAYVRDQPFDFDPGARFKYNNTAYYMLGSVIEQAGELPYAEYLQQELFEPLGLTRTRYDSNRDLILNRAQGYGFDASRGQLMNDRIIGMSNPGAAGALLSTAGDLVRWQIALSTGRVVSEASYQQMTTPTALDGGETNDYGFGLSLGEQDGRRRIGHGGGIFGFNSMLSHYPDHDLHVAVISNCNAVDSGDLARRIARMALGEAEPTHADLDVDGPLSRRLSGTYAAALDENEVRIRIVARDDRLFARVAGQPETQLLFQGGLEFRVSADPSVRIVFEEPADDAVGPDDPDSPAAALVVHQGGQTHRAARVGD